MAWLAAATVFSGRERMNDLIRGGAPHGAALHRRNMAAASRFTRTSRPSEERPLFFVGAERAPRLSRWAGAHSTALLICCSTAALNYLSTAPDLKEWSYGFTVGLSLFTLAHIPVFAVRESERIVWGPLFLLALSLTVCLIICQRMDDQRRAHDLFCWLYGLHPFFVAPL